MDYFKAPFGERLSLRLQLERLIEKEDGDIKKQAMQLNRERVDIPFEVYQERLTALQFLAKL